MCFCVFFERPHRALSVSEGKGCAVEDFESLAAGDGVESGSVDFASCSAAARLEASSAGDELAVGDSVEPLGILSVCSGEVDGGGDGGIAMLSDGFSDCSNGGEDAGLDISSAAFSST